MIVAFPGHVLPFSVYHLQCTLIIFFLNNSLSIPERESCGQM